MMAKIIPVKILLLSFVLMLSACAYAPNVHNVRVLSKIDVPVQRLMFVYRDLQMKKHQRFGHGNVTVADVGFEQFGPILVENASNVFSKYGLTVEKSALYPAGKKIDYKGVVLEDNKKPLYLMTVYPLQGKTTANRHSTRVSYVFVMAVMNMKTKKAIWTAKIDTGTWKGQDFLMRHLPSTEYDKEYAVQFLDSLAQEMKKAKVTQ